MDYSKTLKQLVERLQFLKHTVAFAESCTGGLLSSWLTALPGVSSVYRGSVVSYHPDAKVQLLLVPRSALQSYGEVSLPVALAMAHGARNQLGSDWALSMTGIAGPSGGTTEKPVGTVCFGLVGPGVERSSVQRFGLLPRVEIQQKSALFALDFLLSEL